MMHWQFMACTIPLSIVAVFCIETTSGGEEGLQNPDAVILDKREVEIMKRFVRWFLEPSSGDEEESISSAPSSDDIDNKQEFDLDNI